MNTPKKMFSAWQEVTDGERNQVVFEHLNKTYGAYEIRTNYDRTLAKALFSVMLLSVLLVTVSFFTSSFEPIIDIPPTPPERVDIPYILPPIIPPVTPPITPPASGLKGNELTAPVVTTDSVIPVDSIPATTLATTNTSGNSKDTTSHAGPTGATPVTGGVSIPIDTALPGSFLTDPPSFPGGDQALFNFLRKNLNYPESVKDINGKGVVAVTFILDKEGYVTEVSALKASRYPELNAEAIRVVKKLPKWNPGKQHGHAVKARMILPIRFELKQ